MKVVGKLLTAAGCAALLAGCVDVDTSLGVSVVPDYQKYTAHTTKVGIDRLTLSVTDSLSGYSQTRIVVGAIRDEEFGLTTRSSCVTLIPMGSMDMGSNPVCRSFHFAAAPDTISFADKGQSHLLQAIKVTEMTKALDPTRDFDCNEDVPHGTESISIGTPILNGRDSLAFNLTTGFGQKYLDALSADTTLFHDLTRYTEALPGIYIEPRDPSQGNAGRLNAFNLQLGYDSDLGYVVGNYAVIEFTADYPGNPAVDTTLFLYFGATDMNGVDSLCRYGTAGSYPQYCLNITGHEKRRGENVNVDDNYETFRVEGGGGYKPVIPASFLRQTALSAIKDTIAAHRKEALTPEELADVLSRTVILRATLTLPFVFPEDYTDAYKFPARLSPTRRVHSTDTTVSYMGLTDSSDGEADQGDINRSTLIYSPDITYHLQQLINLDESELKTDYDVWMLFMANETTTTTTTGDEDMQEYYQYLAYQSYYNNMYGGGGYSGNSYSNYYTYMMMAQYASGQTYTSTDVKLDIFRYYNAEFCGPGYPDVKRRPKFSFTFAIPKE